MISTIIDALAEKCAAAEADAIVWRKRAEEAQRRVIALEKATVRKLDRPVHWSSPAATAGLSPNTRKVIDNGRIGELHIAGSMLDELRDTCRNPADAIEQHTDDLKHKLLREVDKLIKVQTEHCNRTRCTVSQMTLIVGFLDP